MFWLDRALLAVVTDGREVVNLRRWTGRSTPSDQDGTPLPRLYVMPADIPDSVSEQLDRMDAAGAREDRAAETATDASVASVHIAKAAATRYWARLLRATTYRALLAGHSAGREARALEQAVDRLQRLARQDDVSPDLSAAILRVTAAVLAVGSAAAVRAHDEAALRTTAGQTGVAGVAVPEDLAALRAASCP